MRPLALLLLLVLLPPARAQDLDSLLETYLAGYWKANPARATSSGVHTYDSQLGDFSPAAIGFEVQRNRAAIEAFEKLDPAALSPAARVDRAIVIERIQRMLFELQQLQRWKRDPGYYVSLLRDAVTPLVEREFAPAERRYAALDARLRLVPKWLQQARFNLDKPSKLDTRRAVQQAAQIADLLEKQVPQAATEQGASRKLRKRVAQDAARAAGSVRQFGAWLQSDLLPRSTGTPLWIPADGRRPAPDGGPGLAADYVRYFAYELGLELTPEELQAAAERDLRDTQEEMRRAAAEIDPNRPLPAILAELAAARLAVEKFPGAFHGALDDAKRFVQQKQLVSLPDRDRLNLLPALPFAGDGLARLQMPGPFEPDLPWIYYLATVDSLPPDPPGWLLRDSNPAAMSLLAVRDAYPGRYLQGEAMNRSPNLARKVFANPAFIEGWALYCEQMVFEQGFRSDPQARLLQLQNALIAQLDAIIDVRLHSGGLGPDDAVNLLVAEGFLDKEAAEQRIEQALRFPARQCAPYAGKLEIVRLREELRKKQGPAFVLKEFHDQLLSLGAPPIPLARQLLLAER